VACPAEAGAPGLGVMRGAGRERPMPAAPACQMAGGLRIFRPMAARRSCAA